MTARVWAEIDIAAIRDNLAAIRSFTGPETQVMAVVKANAYGHGLEIVCRAAWDSGARWFGVATTAEGSAVRDLLPESRICLFAPFLPGEQLEMVRQRIIPFISSKRQVDRLEKACEELECDAEIHLEVDTGMGRSGALPCEVVPLAEEVRRNPRLRLSGLATHLPCGDTDPQFTAEQIRELTRVADLLAAVGVELEVIHAANSGGMIAVPRAPLSLVRPGLLMYGIWPLALGLSRGPEVRPVLSLKTRIALVRDLPAGHTISYGRTHTLQRPSTVATLPVGYGDGYPRELSSRGHVLIHGSRAPILGRVCMDMTVVDVTDIAGVREGDEAVLIGPQGAERIRAEELARMIDTTEHDITTRLTERVVRSVVPAF